MGDYEPFKLEVIWNFVEREDGTKIGYIAHFISAGQVELGYFIVPNERGKGHASEAIGMIVDYLFPSKDIVRVQARADPKDAPSWKALERGGPGENFYRWQWRDDYMYSILREEWKEPKNDGKMIMT